MEMSALNIDCGHCSEVRIDAENSNRLYIIVRTSHRYIIYMV